MSANYRFLTRAPFPLWALLAVAIRIPNASAPLAMVFVGHAATGMYSSGGALAAAFVIGEVGGSALLGWLGHEAHVRRDVTIGLVIGALGFGLLATAALLPYWLLIASAVLAGAGPAQSGGALRAALGRIVPDVDLARAYSIDSVITELVWLIAPAMVAAAAVTVSPFAVLALDGGMLVLATILACTGIGGFLTEEPSRDTDQNRDAEPATGSAGSSVSRSRLLHAWPIYLTSAAALSLLAVAELVLPALLVSRGHDAVWSGVLLAVFAGASAISSIVYGTRTWFGSIRAQSTVLLVGTAGALALMALAPSLVLIALALIVAGVFQSVVMITRNLMLREELPPGLHTSGFTLMYSVQGAGYAVSAILASAVLDRSGPATAIGVGIGMMMGLTSLSVAAEILRRRGQGRASCTEGLS